MGIVRHGPPYNLVLRLKEQFNISCFVESGTCEGETAYWAASKFKHVITMELSESLYEQADERLRILSNVNLIFGDSRIALKEIVPNLKDPALFWLDAHWSGGETYGQNDECPILSELEIINGGKTQHFLLIDDARLFLCPPPGVHQTNQWPTITEIIEKFMLKNNNYYIVVVEDVIVAVPLWAKDVVASYSKEVSTKAWNEHLKSEKRIDRILRLYREGTQELIRRVINKLSFKRKNK